MTRKKERKKDPSTIGGRLQIAMDHAGFKTDNALAKAVDEFLTTVGLKGPDDEPFQYQNVQGVLTGRVKKLSEYMIHYARACNVNPFWLVFNEGSMIGANHKATEGWPFDFPQEYWDQLLPTTKAEIEAAVMRAVLKALKGHTEAKLPQTKSSAK